MTFKIIQGDLLDLAEGGNYSTIMHGCNCFHAMGSGIAGSIAKRYPIVPHIDRTKSEYGDTGKLATYTLAHVKGLVDPQMSLYDIPEKYEFDVINLYTQYKPGPDFLSSLFPAAIKTVSNDFRGQTIGIPMIGCGIGGGDLEHVVRVLLAQGSDVDWEMVLL